mgnify:CR=1 FL=1
MSTTKIVHGTRKTLEDAFNNISFEEYKDYVPTHPKNEWAKKVTKIFTVLSEEKKESIFIVSAFITMFFKYFRCFWTPWTMGESNRKKAFNYEFIEESYAKIMNIVKEYPELDDSLAIKAHYEHLYGYLLAEDFLKGVDEMYWYAKSIHPVMVTRETIIGDGLLILFTGLSIRGQHRTKIWPTYFTPNNNYSRRATTGHYSQLTPEATHHLHGIKSIKRQVNWLLMGTRETVDGKRKAARWIDALHPHISSREPCLGGWQARLSRNAEYGWAKVFIKDIKSYLCTWSVVSPYWNINHQYRHTYNFPAIKGRRKCHWDGIDSQYIRVHFPDILRKDTGWGVARLAMQQKHELGHYTEEFLAKYDAFLQVKMVDRARAMEILNLIHGLDTTEMARQYWGGINDIGYKRIYALKRYGYTLMDSKGGSTTLISTIGGIRPINFFRDMMDRTKNCIETYINATQVNTHWSDLDPVQVSNRKIADNLGSLNRIEEVYTELFRVMSVKEFDERTMLSENPWASNAYYGRYILKLIMDYTFMRKLLDMWVVRTYEREISKLTNLTKEFSNELANHTTNAGQSELFSADLPV